MTINLSRQILIYFFILLKLLSQRKLGKMASKLRIKLGSYTPVSDISSKMPDTPDSATKRFYRRREISNESTHSKKSLHHKTSDFSLKLHTETNEQSFQEINLTHSKEQMLDLIRNTGYIKTSRNSSFSKNDETSFKNKTITLASHKQIQPSNNSDKNNSCGPHSEQKMKKCLSAYKLASNTKCKPLAINFNFNQGYNLDIESKQETDDHKNSKNSKQQIGRIHLLQEEIQIKKSELMILEDKYNRLKRQDGEKQRMIKKLNQEVLKMNKENMTLHKVTEQGKDALNALAEIYFQEEALKLKRQRNLVDKIREFSKMMKRYSESIMNNYEGMLAQVKCDLKESEQYIKRLEVQNHCHYKQKSYYEQLQAQAIKINQQYRRLEKKYKNLNISFEDLRMINIKLKKINTELKFQIQNLKLSKLNQSMQMHTNENSLILQPLSQKIQPTISRILHQLNSQSSNLSLNISDASTEQLNMLDEM